MARLMLSPVPLGAASLCWSFLSSVKRCRSWFPEPPWAPHEKAAGIAIRKSPAATGVSYSDDRDRHAQVSRRNRCLIVAGALVLSVEQFPQLSLQSAAPADLCHRYAPLGRGRLGARLIRSAAAATAAAAPGLAGGRIEPARKSIHSQEGRRTCRAARQRPPHSRPQALRSER